ncbi:MAG TPA: nucleotidyltransferase domain-containing protein [Chloroflexota bacterium]|nr:nucleotidyltransferase domain-containing protein [Chloroflexota bacterium]
MTRDERPRRKREDIFRLCARYGARNPRVFGCAARGQADEQSDLDLLIEMEPWRSLFDLGGLQYELEQLIGCPAAAPARVGARRDPAPVRGDTQPGPHARSPRVPPALRARLSHVCRKSP